MNLPPHSVLAGHCAEVNSWCSGKGHCEFTCTQCPSYETEAGNSNTNRGAQDTRFITLRGLARTFASNNHAVEQLQSGNAVNWCSL